MSGLDLRFRTALARMEKAGRVTHVKREVSTDLEIAGLMKRHDGDRALLFERVKGHAIPVIGDLLASSANVEAAFGLDRRGVRAQMRAALTDPLPPQDVDRGPCQDVVKRTGIDLEKDLPVLRHSSGDAGRFITAGVVIVRDPETGIHNASYHRLQLLGGDRTAIRLDYGRHLRTAFERAQKAQRPLPIAVCLGTDLALHYAAAYMGSQMPLDADELAAAGGIAGRPLEMVRCVTQDLSVVAETEIVLEGEVTFDTVHEGPFAEFVGYQSDAGPAPVVNITALTHRRDPIYHAINGTGRETIMLRKYVLEASALQALRAAAPIVQDVEMTPGGLYRFHMILQVKKERPQDEGMQRNAMLAAFGALKDLDLVVAVDDDIDIRDGADVEYAIATRFEASSDLLLIPGARGHEYIRVSNGGIRTKVGIDATVPPGERARFQRAQFAKVELRPEDIA